MLFRSSELLFFRFGIEGTLQLEALCAALNNRIKGPEGNVSDSIKYDAASHTVTIHKVRKIIKRERELTFLSGRDYINIVNIIIFIYSFEIKSLNLVLE